MILEPGVAEVVPGRTAVLEAMGVPTDVDPPPHIARLVAGAEEVFRGVALPAGMVAELEVEEFARVLAASEGNAPEPVVARVAPGARCLALFVVTLGPGVDRAVARGFADGDFPLAAALDALASHAADAAAEWVERTVEARWRAEGRLAPGEAALRYSPGYCGWHVSGQRALFRRLGPEGIGVRLTDGGFMDPAKSVSGVILAGPREIHRFSPTYPFCADCATHECRERMRALFGRGRPEDAGAAAGPSGGRSP